MFHAQSTLTKKKEIEDWEKYKNANEQMPKSMRKAEWNHTNDILTDSLRNRDTKQFLHEVYKGGGGSPYKIKEDGHCTCRNIASERKQSATE